MSRSMRSSQQRCRDWSSRRPEGPSPTWQDSNATEGVKANSLEELRGQRQQRQILLTHTTHNSHEEREKHPQESR